MLESLGKIKNPITRSVVAAAAVGSIATLAAALVLGTIAPKDKSANRFGVYSSVLGIVGGAVFGLVYTETKDSKEKKSVIATELQDSQVWQDWRNFVVVRKVKESEEITSFYLKPEDQGPIPNFVPGQFLTIKLDIPGQPRPIIRTYSLSDYTEPCEYYRLSIKREPAPKGLDVPPGVASNFMHDHIQEGSVIPAKPPSGEFVIDVHKPLPAVLISNGVGITPMFSMAKACTTLKSKRPVFFVHGARDGRFHAFREDVLALAQQNPSLQTHFRYSRPNPEDEGKYNGVGYVDTPVIQELVGKDAEFFLCGSPSFMDSLREGLQKWGVPESQIFFEAFSKPAPTASKGQSSSSGDAIQEAEIVFAKSGKTVTWRQGDGTILEFAEANEIYPPFSCRAGVCGTCMCKVVEGEVAYQEPPTARVKEGSVLICISQPKTSKVVLEV